MSWCRRIVSLVWLGVGTACGGSNTAAASPVSPPVVATVTVRGTVLSAVGSAPVIGATVNIGARTATTDSLGRYVVTGVVPSTQAVVQISAPGFAPYSITIPVASDGTTHDVRLQVQTLVETTVGSVYVPPIAGPVRVAVVWFSGGDSRGYADGRTSTGNPMFDPAVFDMHRAFLAWAQTNQAAVVGMRFSTAEQAPDNVAATLRDAAAQLKRPELERIPLVVVGGSAGAVPAWAVTTASSRRVAAFFLNIPATVPATLPADSILAIPGMFMMAELDDVVDNKPTVAFAVAGRAAGARWAYAVERNQAHRPFGARARTFFFGWADAVLQRRVPLAPLSESSGWLGDPGSFSVASWADFPGTRSGASWFTGPEMAGVWRTLVTDTSTP